MKLSNDKEWSGLLKKWKESDREKQYRTNYPELNQNSIVFDLGGYHGQWASDIYSRYQCKIYIFEPHPDYFRMIKDRFEKNEKVNVFNFGLGGQDEKLMLSTEGDASSVFHKGKNLVEIQIMEAKKFIDKEKFDYFDLMKINIEGGEYQLIDHLITSGKIVKIKNLQVQFHHFVPNAEELMNDLHSRLAVTHEPTYLYRFFWENWKLKE